MTPGPGDELTPSAGGRGHLRVSHADRERVVDFLKAAFVQGRLTKEELEERASQALGSRTYAELAELTADLPGESITAPPPRQTRDRARLPMGKIVLVGTAALTAPTVLAAAVITHNEDLASVFVLIFPFYFMGWLAAVVQILDNVRKRSRGQWPPRPAHPDRALEGEQDGATGDGPMLTEARDHGRSDHVPGRRGSKRSRRSLPERPARRVPVDLRGTA